MTERNVPDDVSFEKLAETSPSAITKVDKHGNIVYANRRAEEILGLEKSEITGRAYDDTAWKITDFEGDEYTQEKLPFQIVKRTEEPVYDVRHAIKWPDGERKFLSVNASPLFDETGNFEGMVAVIEDITERMQTDKELQTSEQRYRRLFETAQDGMLILNADTGKIKDANPYIRDLLGFSKEELVGKQLWEIGTFQDLVENKEKFEKLVEEGYVRYKHLPLETKSGEEASVEFVSNTYMVNGQKVVQCNIRDITERKKAKKKRKRSEKRYRTVFENTGTAMIIFEEDTTISLANEEAETLTGHTKEELEGTSWTEFIAREEQLEKMKEYHSLRREDPDSAPNQYEFKLIDKAGNERDVLMTVDMMSGTNKSVASMVDITGRKEAERKLRKSEKKFRSYVENAPIGVFLVDDEGNYIEANEAACEMTGYSEEELLDMKVSDLHPPEINEDVRKAFAELLETGSMNVDLPYLRKDGTEGYFVINALEISEDRYLGFTLDITKRKEAQQQLEQATFETLQALNRTIEAKDKYTGEHIDRVQKFSVEIGKKLGMPEGRLEQLRYASILHDIGKIGIPDSILGKPDKLTEDEWKEMERHPEIGERIVGQVDQLKRAAKIIGQHQEKYNGSGYPKGLEGEEITLEARIVAVADAWDAMRTDRPYRDALPKAEALKELRENAGSQFDPELVEVLVEMIEDGEIEFGGE